MSHNTIKNLPISEKPYEKCASLGVASLSDAELLAIIIHTGTRDLSAIEIARNVLSVKHGNLLNLFEFSLEEFMDFKGIGKYKAIRLMAIAELSLRISKTNMGNPFIMDDPKKVSSYYMEQLRHLKEEHFYAVFLDIQCRFLKDELIAKGNENFAFYSKNRLFEKALLCKARRIILLHNHPSGNCRPSKEDCDTTSSLIQAAQLLELELVDHIIIGDNKYYSFKENDLI